MNHHNIWLKKKGMDQHNIVIHVFYCTIEGQVASLDMNKKTIVMHATHLYNSFTSGTSKAFKGFLQLFSYIKIKGLKTRGTNGA